MTPSAYIIPRFNLATKKDGLKSIFFNLFAFLIVTGSLVFVAIGADQMTAPIAALSHDPITLDPYNLFEYSFRTVLRMLIAICFSLVFSLTYASIAAKSKHAEQIMIPLLDVFQSVPILGYISFTVTAFLALFPGDVLGAECAAIFAIFTSQVWNMTFSFYQSLKGVPQDLYDTSAIFKMSKWQRFWRMEVPYGIPGLVWNMSVSMSGGWFFVVAAEVITVGDSKITLPGIGSYIALALQQENISAIFYAIAAMVIVILIYDQLLIKTLVAWSDKFRYEMTASNRKKPTSWVLILFERSSLVQKIFEPLKYLGRFLLYSPIFTQHPDDRTIAVKHTTTHNPIMDYAWYAILTTLAAAVCYHLVDFINDKVGFVELFMVIEYACFTMLRIFVLIILASLVWVPIGIYIGLNPRFAAVAQPIVQFLAAFPANLLFPVVVIVISKYSMNPDIWLSPLIIIGAQWYILFNVIAGASSLPNDLREATQNLSIKGWLWLRKVMLPAIAPYFITGAIAASGGAWNASIVAEVVVYGDKRIVAHGLGSYIAEMTVQADFHRIALGIAVMSLCVVLINHFLWQPLHDYASKKYRL